jgi:restriction system protein
MAIASKLPWWLGAALAALSFLVLHWIAGAFQTPASANELADLGSAAIQSGVHRLASIAQFVVPIICSAAAAASLIQRFQAARAFDGAAANPAGAVSAMGWQDFERLVCEAFRREGYRVDERGGSAPDGAIDLIATKAKKRILIQCKHWKSRQVGVAVVREINAVVAARRADGGVVVTGGTFTKEASTFARMAKIRLIDADALEQMIAPTRSRTGVSGTVEAGAEAGDTPVSPACPKCGARMIDRVAKQGKFSGRHFWSCGQYPKCRGVLPGW